MRSMPVTEFVIHPDEGAEYFFREGCSILELDNSASDPGASIARARVAPGLTTRWHCLEGVKERYLIVAGRGEVEIGDTPAQAVSSGDLVSIPPGVRQRIRNTGTNDLLFYAICTPRFTPDRYRDLEADDGDQPARK